MGERERSARSLPRLAVTLGAASVDTASAERAMCNAIWTHAGEVTLPPALCLRTPVPESASRAPVPAPLRSHPGNCSGISLCPSSLRTIVTSCCLSTPASPGLSNLYIWDVGPCGSCVRRCLFNLLAPLLAPAATQRMEAPPETGLSSLSQLSAAAPENGMKQGNLP